MKLRKLENRNRGNAMVLIGIGVMLCVVLLGGILGQLVKNQNDTAAVDQPAADDQLVDPDDLDSQEPSDDTTSTDGMDETTPPEEGLNGFAVTLSCIEDTKVWLDVQNPNDVAFEYEFAVNGDPVELQDEDFTSFSSRGRSPGTTAFEFEGVLARYYTENISSIGSHRSRPWNVRLTAVLTETGERLDVWSVRDLVFHDYDLQADELTLVLSRYEEAKPGQPARMYVEYESSRPGRTTYLLRYEGGETFAQKVPNENLYWAYLDGYPNLNEDEETPRVCLVIDEQEVPIGGAEEGEEEEEKFTD